MKTRRDLVTQAMRLAGTSVLGLGLGRCLRAFGSGLDAALIGGFRNKLSGRLILPGDANYDAARAVAARNPETDKRPAVIVRCQSEQDVLRSIDFAHENQLEIAIRSGNHSFLGWGTCDRGMVVDLSPLKGVSVNPAQRSALVQAGSNAGEIVAATARFGLAPVLGECPTVGTGLALGGGLGWLSPLYGATCDNVLSARVITAKARVLDVDHTSNEDLFWAMRGGGGNFGVATQLRYRLHPVNQVLAGSLIYPVSMARTMLQFFCDFMSTAPDELQAECQLRTDHGGQFCVQIVHSGHRKEGEKVLEQFRKVSSSAQDLVRPRRYADLYAMADDWEHSWTFQLIKATYLEQVSQEAIDLLVDRFAQRPPACETAINFDHYMHGQVCRIPSDATAFQLRNSGAVHVGFWTAWRSPSDADRCMPWVHETYRLLQPYSGGRMYSNYMSSSGPKAAKSLFGSNYGRLTKIKEKYDPENFFHLNPSIATSGESPRKPGAV